ALKSTRAQGMPGARRTHCLTRKIKKKRAGSTQVRRHHPALPPRWAYGCSVISSANQLFATVACESLHRLVPCIGGTGPHGPTGRVCPAVLRRHRPPSQHATRLV